MALTVNSNIASLTAQRNLGRSQGMLNKSLTRLSSGLRINSAKDDAAGLAISDRMTSQVRGLNQAVRNANDGISLAQTAEGALQETTNLLQRMRELSVQSRNDTNTDSDRASLDNEFQQLKDEIDRIATTTAFNGRNVLDGSMSSAVFQVGANVGETISLDVGSSMASDSIGSYASVQYTLANDVDNATGDDNSLDGADDFVLNGTNVGTANNGTNGRGDGSAYSIANQINLTTATHGVTAEAGSTDLTVTAGEISSFGFVEGSGGTPNDDTLTYTLSINDQLLFQQVEGASNFTATTLAQQINAQQANTGVTASVQDNGDMILTASDGRNIEISEVLADGTAGNNDVVTGYFGNVLTEASGGTITNVDITKTTLDLSADRAISFVRNNTSGLLTAGDGTTTTNVANLDASDILSTAASDLSINRIDQAIEQVDVFRSDLGAVQNRLESTISNLQNVSENISAARSRIMDADFASETASLTKSQILQQAGIAMLSQANQLPQAALSLLQ